MASTGRPTTTRRRARRPATTGRWATPRTPSCSRRRSRRRSRSTNPFPNGVLQPTGNTLGALTSLDSNISFVDQNRTAPRVQQWSADVQRELGAGMALTFTYMGARGDHLPLGGSNDIAININQLDPKYLALGAGRSRRSSCRIRSSATRTCRFLSSTPTTLPRSTLLRPFPQYAQVQRPPGHRRLQPVQRRRSRVEQARHARLRRSHQLHLQSAEGQSDRRDELLHERPVRLADEQLQLRLVVAGVPGGAAVHHRLLRSDRRVRLRDPRRAAPRHHRAHYELPFGKGKKYGSNSGIADAIIGGWTVSALINLQSGFPINVGESNPNSVLGGGVGARPNIVVGRGSRDAGQL